MREGESRVRFAAPVPAAPVGDDIALAIRGLVKIYGNLIAVADLSLDIPTGSFYGIVGPNGAGKTTTLTMATGLLTPDRGTAYVHGVDVWARHPGGARPAWRHARRHAAPRPPLRPRLPRPRRHAARPGRLRRPRARPRAPGGPRPGRGRQEADQRLLGGHDEEDRAGRRPHSLPACPGPRRTLRGRGPRLRGQHPPDPHRLHQAWAALSSCPRT